MRLLLILLPLTLLLQLVQAQNSDFEAIKENKQYIWGLGISEDYEQAIKLALDDLIGKISVHVESEFEYVAQEDNTDFKAYSKSVISTYSSATLIDTKHKQYEKKGVFYILRYIEVADFQKIFTHREQKIRDYLHLGAKAQQEYRIGDALKYYYWSYALFLSHPYREDLKIPVDDREMMVGIVLADRINSLLTNINFEVARQYKDDDKTKLILTCTYFEEKVSKLDFRFFPGGNRSTMHEVSEGLSEVFLYGTEQEAIEKLNIQVEYKYTSKSSQDKELATVLETVKIPFFKRSSHQVNIPNATIKKITPKKMIQPVFEEVNKLTVSKSFYTKTISKLLVSIASNNYEEAYPYFSADGLEMFKKLIQYGQVSVFPLTDTLKIVQLNDETIVRSVPMAFYFPNSKKQFTENVVFTFDNLKMVSAISFAISDKTIYDIVSHGDGFGGIKEKYTLIKFMEYYKTAYSLKRLDYIESIFSDNALIIVGTILERAQPIDGMYKNIGEKGVKYQRYTKKDYITRLENVFNSKEYINIDFEEAEVRKLNGSDNIYGIQLSQHYYSSNYSDFGYLFLMIDLNDTLHPTIYVRTWQPQKNDDGSIYGLEDFRMN
ncbi:MAG: hypothetical protein RBR87_03245 [Bacteroidales bacterium]|jgi:hypothetical protein|nr:hypothetical protein [Bacteroidales bacterium]